MCCFCAPKQVTLIKRNTPCQIEFYLYSSMSHNQQSSAVHTTLLGTPDYHGNTYKMVDVDIPAGEDPCYMCHHEASVYTKSGLEVTTILITNKVLCTIIQPTSIDQT